MTPSTSQQAPGPEELDALLRLLDDDTPLVRKQISERLAASGGDLSDYLSTRPQPLSADEQRILSNLLSEGRRRTLMEDWQVPSSGALGLREDWEQFESLLRVLSDFLHDGITCRQPLSDALDLLAEEAEEADVRSAEQLRFHLFQKQVLRGNHKGYDDPRNSDLAWCIDEGKSNPIGLGLIYTLVARRMQLVVEPIPFPQHFLCRIHTNGRPMVVDCFNRGQLHTQEELLKNPDLSQNERRALTSIADPGTILIRMLNNLNSALRIAGREKDAELVNHLRDSLVSPGS